MPFIGHGTTLTFGAHAWQIRSIGGPNIEVADIDVTHMGSSNRWMEYLPGLIEGGQIDIEVITDNSETFPISPGATPAALRIDWPDGYYFSCDAYVKTFRQTTSRETLSTTTISFKLTGEPTFAQA